MNRCVLPSALQSLYGVILGKILLLLALLFALALANGDPDADAELAADGSDEYAP